MKDLSQTLSETWNSIHSYDRGSLQLGIQHPLEWYVGYETELCKALIIIAHSPIENLDSSKSINVVCNKRFDGSYYIAFNLMDKKLEVVFLRMCSEIIEFSSNSKSEQDALKKVAIRYKQWRRLMEHNNCAVLSDNKRLGLIGELLYLKMIIETSKPPLAALDGWVGPDGSDQDFVYDGLWREIKTTCLSSDQISIHSFEQLGNHNDRGELHIYRVDSCAPETNNSFTLRELFKYFTDLFSYDLNLVDSFTNKLNSIGYVDMKDYDKFYYKFYRSDVYDVNDTFPRIVRTDIRPEVKNIEYVLSISNIEVWKKG